ncbi:MAG: hypothetical protein GF411_20495 [Candidatus Lokiarchaeota archaeon]|nr:hypothetical protein [Candidatus Lokiarchaeota archaeon]
MPKKKRRILIISDLHSGHQVGLTPPSWHDKVPDTADPARKKLAEFREQSYEVYYKTVKKLKPIDILIVNADCIDGRGEKSGQTELLTSSRDRQCDMAAEIIKFVNAKNIVMTYGTPYHTGSLEDFEDQIAKEVKAEKIGGHEWVEVNGLVFDIKHKVGSSTIPHGRMTPIAKERLWNLLWSEREESPKSNIIIRSHVHYHNYCGGDDWLAMTTPALQGPGSKYGTRQCAGTVDFGMIHFDVNASGSYEWQSHITRLLDRKKMLLKL